MIQLNPRYEAIFNPDNIDQNCDEIASLVNVEADFIKEALDAGLYKQAIRITSSILLQTSSFIHSTMVSFYVQKENVNYVVRHYITRYDGADSYPGFS